MNFLIDTHSHIDVHDFAHDFHEVLHRARKACVIAQIIPGVCQSWWENLLNICMHEDDLFPAIGLHPMYLEMHRPEHLDQLRHEVENGSLVALGEIGLDYFIEDAQPDRQQKLFLAQLALAHKNGLPILLHVRKAHDQVLALLRRRRFEGGGIVHAFSGSLQQAEHYIKLGFKISFGGSLTYDRAKKIRRIAAALPLHALVLETDAPDIPPVQHHGERNSPEYLPLVLNALAHLRPEPIDELAYRTTANAIEVLHLHTLIKQPSFSSGL